MPLACSPPPGLEMPSSANRPHWIRYDSSATSAASSEHEGAAPSSINSQLCDSGESTSCEMLGSSQVSVCSEPTGENCRADDAPKVQQPTVQSHGSQRSIGSELHDSGKCVPCAFYCFKKQGCGKGVGCGFCHMAHVSNKKLRQQEWRQKQQRRTRKQCGASKGISDQPEAQAVSAAHVLMDMKEPGGSFARADD